MNQNIVKNNKQKNQKVQTDEDTDIDMDCQCQILNDTSLSNVNDSDCSCSQCLQANLNAFNQFKVQQQLQQRRSTLSVNKQTVIAHVNRRNNASSNKINKNSNQLNRNSSLNVNKKTVPIFRNQLHQFSVQNNQNQYNDGPQNLSQYEGNQFTEQNLNDYILVTRQRTRKYIQQRKKLENQNKKEKDEFKKKIKENLEILKYTAKVKRDISKAPQQNYSSQPRNYKWNHQPVITKRMQLVEEYNKKRQQEKQKGIIIPKKHLHKELNSNLNKFNPQFPVKRDQILEKIKQRRIQKLKPKKGCPHDHCPNHHMRTSPTKIKKIEQFIKKQVQKYQKKQQKLKKKQIQKQKVKQAKLRAIEIKSKQILAKSKKYEDRLQQRSSFHLSIDHFSTFSELKQTQQQKKQAKDRQKNVKKMLKTKNNKIQQAIYEDLEEQFNINEQQIINKEKRQQQKNKEKEKKQQTKKNFNEKIVKLAGITSPRVIKQEDKNRKVTKNNKQKNIIEQRVREQEKKKAEIQLQIQRKKRQLMKQFKKQQEFKQSKNLKIKQKYNNYLNVE